MDLPGVGYCGWRRGKDRPWEIVPASKGRTKAEAFDRLMEVCELAGHRTPHEPVEYLILPADEQPQAKHYQTAAERKRWRTT